MNPTPEDIDAASSETQGWGEGDEDDQNNVDDDTPEAPFPIDDVCEEDRGKDEEEVRRPNISEISIEDDPNEPEFGKKNGGRNPLFSRFC